MGFAIFVLFGFRLLVADIAQAYAVFHDEHGWWTGVAA